MRASEAGHAIAGPPSSSSPRGAASSSSRPARCDGCSSTPASPTHNMWLCGPSLDSFDSPTPPRPASARPESARPSCAPSYSQRPALAPPSSSATGRIIPVGWQDGMDDMCEAPHVRSDSLRIGVVVE
eukprot:1059513-Prymnesium_polylepis.2